MSAATPHASPPKERRAATRGATRRNNERRQYEYWAPKTQPLGTGGDMHVAFGFCAQAALCEIDMRTGEVQVRKVIAAHDVGRAINPLTLEGQIEGGIVMCIGYALTEHYIQEDGMPWTNVMARYKTPSITHTPTIISHIVEHETSTGPFGAKGVGELPSIPTSAAITNAIYRATGVRVRSLPVDQDELLRAMRAEPPKSNSAGATRSPSPRRLRRRTVKLIPDIREDVLQKSIARARERNIILPTFAQQKDPTLVPDAITARLKDVGLWDLDPANLFRITWKNEPVEHGGGFGEGNWIEFPPR